MKVRLKSPDHIVLGFTRREIMIMTNCINESCHGLIMDRFVPARQDLIELLDTFKDIQNAEDYFRLKPVPA